MSWETGALLGEYTTRSFGEFPNEENASRLSQILEDSPHPKYCLSARACQGILNRAKRRGKNIPEILLTALERQTMLPPPRNVSYNIGSYNSNAWKSDNPNSGVYQTEQTKTLDALTCGKPDCNQGGTAIVSIEGNGSRESHRGDGYSENGVSYTLNSVERHAICIGNGQADQLDLHDKAGALNCMHDQQAVLVDHSKRMETMYRQQSKQQEAKTNIIS